MFRLGLMLALVGGCTSPAARRWLTARRSRRRERRAVAARSAAMGDYCAAVSRRLRGGDTLLQALHADALPDAFIVGASDRTSRGPDDAGSAAAADAFGAGDGPTAEPLRQIAVEHERGVTLGRAVERWAARESTSAAALLSTAVTLASERVGAQPELFDHVAATLRARADVAAEARVHVAQARASVWVVTALPWAVALALLAEGGDAARVLTATPLGWFCLTAALLLEAAGVGWMRAAVRGALR